MVFSDSIPGQSQSRREVVHNLGRAQTHPVECLHLGPKRLWRMGKNRRARCDQFGDAQIHLPKNGQPSLPALRIRTPQTDVLAQNPHGIHLEFFEGRRCCEDTGRGVPQHLGAL